MQRFIRQVGITLGRHKRLVAKDLPDLAQGYIRHGHSRGGIMPEVVPPPPQYLSVSVLCLAEHF
jgi:hypothetical protein